MSIISNDPISYFRGIINIPFDNKNTSDFEAIYLDYYEGEILVRLLGYTLYKEVVDNYDTNNDDQWKALVEGSDYTVTINDVDYTVKWNGLWNSAKVSLITDYVYFNWLRQNNEQVVGTGTSISQKENADNYDKNFKLVQSYNRCAELGGSEQGHELDATLYNFILNNKDDYPNWVFNELEKTNILGI